MCRAWRKLKVDQREKRIKLGTNMKLKEARIEINNSIFNPIHKVQIH